jgi:hypothetical protein
MQLAEDALEAAHHSVDGELRKRWRKLSEKWLMLATEEANCTPQNTRLDASAGGTTLSAMFSH